MDLLKIINEEVEEFNRSEYLRWKRKNVTLRGIQDRYSGIDGNGGMASYGVGLYTAFLGNRALAKQYGKVYFVLGAIPEHPKIVNNVNDAEIFMQNLKFNYGKKNGLDNYFEASDLFNKNTNIETEMMKLGYDGFIIKGREIVNYKPNNDNIKYFENERQLENYYMDLVRWGKIDI
jgi:hypothetical protein